MTKDCQDLRVQVFLFPPYIRKVQLNMEQKNLVFELPSFEVVSGRLLGVFFVLVKNVGDVRTVAELSR